MLQSLLSKVSVREMSTILRIDLQPRKWMVEYIPLMIKVRQMHFHPKIGSSNVEDFSLQGDIVHSRKRKKANGTQGENSKLIGSQDTHVLNQYLQQMRMRPHKKLNAFHVVGNLESSEIADEIRHNREAC